MPIASVEISAVDDASANVRVPENLCEIGHVYDRRTGRCVNCGEQVFDPVESLAWALFRTETRVIAFVNSVADAAEPRELTNRPGYIGSRFRLVSPNRLKRAYAIAWDRDEQGWRTECMKRARDVLRLWEVR